MIVLAARRPRCYERAVGFQPVRPRGGVATQRTANPCTPVRFRARPPSTKSNTYNTILPISLALDLPRITARGKLRLKYEVKGLHVLCAIRLLPRRLGKFTLLAVSRLVIHQVQNLRE